MNMFARFDENSAMTLPDIKETKHYRRTDIRTDNVKTVYPPLTKFARGGGGGEEGGGGGYNYCLMQVKSIGECSKGSILQ